MEIALPPGHGPVGLDTSPFIYFIEEKPAYIKSCAELFDRVASGELTIVTSVVTLLDVLVHPFQRGEWELAEQYRDILLHSTGLFVLDVDAVIAERAAQLRARYALRTPDSLQIATALAARASSFVTTDRELAQVQELPIILMEKAS